MNIQEQLNLLCTIKANLKFKLMEKGVSIDDNTPFSLYPNLLDRIQIKAEKPSIIKENISSRIISDNLHNSVSENEVISRVFNDNLTKSESPKEEILQFFSESVTENIFSGWIPNGNLTRQTNDYYSGFNNNNYLSNIVKSIILPNEALSFIILLKTDTDVTTQQAILGSAQDDDSLFIGIKDGEWCIVDKQYGKYESNCRFTGGTVMGNTDYYLKVDLKSDGTTTLSYASGNLNFIQAISVTRTQDLIMCLGKSFNCDGMWYGFKGYIKDATYSNIGFIKVGNPLITTDNVLILSPDTAAAKNYLINPTDIVFEDNSEIEFYTRVKLINKGSKNCFIFINFYGTGNRAFRVEATFESIKIITNVYHEIFVTTDEWHDIYIKRTINTIYATVDGNIICSGSAPTCINLTTLKIGGYDTPARHIDLNETKLYINGDLIMSGAAILAP